jgi:hypothetical protein
MMMNIQRLANKPHPSGFNEIEFVRSQILAEIKSMGITPIVEETIYTSKEIEDVIFFFTKTSSKEDFWMKYQKNIEKKYDVHNVDDWFNPMTDENGILSLKNILVKIDAPNTERAIMFMSHYDSVRFGPGAADDMSSVCAMLETIRAQAQNQFLQNDLYFLFTDGEENTLLGALAFVKSHPELKQNIDMLINLDWRGTSGGVLLLETSPHAYPLISYAAKSNAKIIGMSLTAAIYSMMSISRTDFTAFANNGYQGLNFLALEGVKNYHEPTDNFENMNKATAWHQLNIVSAIANYAANNSFDEIENAPSDAIYFPFFPGVMILMNSFVSHLLCAIICIITLIFIFVQVRNKSINISTIVFLALLFLLSILSELFFVSGSYLFYIPLFSLLIVEFVKKRNVACITAKIASGIITLLLWVPVFFILWIGLIEPMIV